MNKVAYTFHFLGEMVAIISMGGPCSMIVPADNKEVNFFGWNLIRRERGKYGIKRSIDGWRRGLGLSRWPKQTTLMSPIIYIPGPTTTSVAQ